MEFFTWELGDPLLEDTEYALENERVFVCGPVVCCGIDMQTGWMMSRLRTGCNAGHESSLIRFSAIYRVLGKRSLRPMPMHPYRSSMRMETLIALLWPVRVRHGCLCTSINRSHILFFFGFASPASDFANNCCCANVRFGSAKIFFQVMRLGGPLPYLVAPF